MNYGHHDARERKGWKIDPFLGQHSAVALLSSGCPKEWRSDVVDPALEK